MATHSFFGKETRSIFLLPVSSIKEKLESDISYIKEISLSRTFPRTLRVSFTERIPVAVALSHGTPYLLDNEGILFFRPSDSLSLARIVMDDTAKVFSQGDTFLQPHELSPILEMKSIIEGSFTISIEEIRILSLDEVRFFTTENWYFTATMREDITLQAEKLLEVFVLLSQEEREALEYIDVRFGRVYYR
jgi:cell division septal protein FtsQ